MSKTYVEVEKKGGQTQILSLHESELKLIKVIRSIEYGEIEGLKIKNQLPISYRAAKKTCKV